jgi:hypothetical protein
MMLEVGARIMKKQKTEKEINLAFLMDRAAEIKRRRMMEREMKVGYPNNDLEI